LQHGGGSRRFDARLIETDSDADTRMKTEEPAESPHTYGTVHTSQ
jgi:hypothetical protein